MLISHSCHYIDGQSGKREPHPATGVFFFHPPVFSLVFAWFFRSICFFALALSSYIFPFLLFVYVLLYLLFVCFKLFFLCFLVFNFIYLSVYRACWRMYLVPFIAQHNDMALHYCLHRSLRPQSLHLSRTKNQRGHWVCWMPTSRKNGLMWRTHTYTGDAVATTTTSSNN